MTSLPRLERRTNNAVCFAPMIPATCVTIGLSVAVNLTGSS